MYIHNETLELVTWLELNTRIYKEVSIPVDGSMKILAYDYVNGSTVPMYDEATEKLVEAAPVLKEGKFYKSYNVITLTVDELEDKFKASVPKSVKRLHAMKAMKVAEVWVSFQAVIGLNQDAKDEWDYSPTLDRDSEFVAMLAPAIGLTDIQIDELFILAGTL